ncbi:hypothetical protein EK21DRAFT_80555, partial [Setomelanomma holmii]
IGGSVPGIMLAIICARHAVLVLEESASTFSMDSRAGCMLGPYAKKMFEHHIPSPELLSTAIPNQELLSIISIDGHIKQHMSYVIGDDYPMSTTNWGAVYQALTQAFDARSSSETDAWGAATVTLRTGVKVISAESREGAWEVTYDIGGTERVVTADILVGADGSNSIIRSLVSSDRKSGYAGYSAWLGMVPDTMDLPAELDGILDGKLIWVNMPKHYISMYAIPCKDRSGSCNRGKHVEFCWYFKYNRDPPELESIMTDFEGLKRKGTDAPDRQRAEAWRYHLNKMLSDVPLSFKPIFLGCETPRVAKITSMVEENASHYNGKLVLIGDAFSQFPPHLGGSFDVAAMQAITLKDLLENADMEPKDWNDWVVEYAQNTRRYSVDVGEYGMMDCDSVAATAID